MTCLECIEHIPDPGFEVAVANLQVMFRRKLIVSVPLCEAEPLYKGHHEEFTAARLRELFPGAEITVLLLERQAHWAMVEITRSPVSTPQASISSRIWRAGRRRWGW